MVLQIRIGKAVIVTEFHGVEDYAVSALFYGALHMRLQVRAAVHPHTGLQAVEEQVCVPQEKCIRIRRIRARCHTGRKMPVSRARFIPDFVSGKYFIHLPEEELSTVGAQHMDERTGGRAFRSRNGLRRTAGGKRIFC